jgi:biotin operon repressor
MFGNVKGGASPLGIRTKRLRIVDYYTVPWEDVRAGTPAPVMIASRDLSTGLEEVFAWHLVAERQGIPPEEILTRQGDLERAVLIDFHRHVKESPRAWWVHWGLHSVEFGFPALIQRARALGLNELRFPVQRLRDLAGLLKQQLGDDYVPHKRFWSLIRLNNLNDHQLLDVDGLTAAFREGDFCRMLRSLRRKLYCIECILGLFFAGKLKIAADPSAQSPVFPSKRDIPWMACARAVLAGSRTFVPPEAREQTEVVPDVVLPDPVPPTGEASEAGDTSAASAPSRQTDAPFIPTELQRRILQKLDGKVLTLDALAQKLETDRSRVHRDGIKELKDRGFVKNNRRLGGYYRPDSPPPDYRDLLPPR